MLDERFEKGLGSPQPFEALRDLATHLFEQGIDQPTVLAAFEQARQALREAGREREEDLVMDVMDCLVGWCGPHMRLPPADSPPDAGR